MFGLGVEDGRQLGDHASKDVPKLYVGVILCLIDLEESDCSLLDGPEVLLFYLSFLSQYLIQFVEGLQVMGGMR
jgi:hypothetical protein